MADATTRWKCDGCQRYFQPSSRQLLLRFNGAYPTFWCSVACRRTWHNYQVGEVRRLRARLLSCANCGDAIGLGRVRRLCQGCAKPKGSPYGGCRSCGADRWAPTSPYCHTCATKARADSNRRKNNKRRGARSTSYRISEIALRDGFRCHLCRGRVDMRLSGAHPKGPTIDHLIPVSAGGDDEPANVALAHRECNVRRNVGGEVQLRLLG